MKKLLFILNLLIFSGQIIFAQVNDLDLFKVQQTNTYVNNSSLLAVDTVIQFYNLELKTNFKDGNLNQINAPQKEWKYGMFTEGIKQHNGFVFAGKLKYDQIKEKDRNWNSAYDYNARMPYFLFDTIAGDWNKTHLQMQAQIARPYLTKRISAGVDVAYLFTTAAKQIDPRYIVRNNQISIAPSITYHFSKNNALAFQFTYASSKESNEAKSINNFDKKAVFFTTGLGTLTIGGSINTPTYYKNLIRPQISFVRKKKNHQLIWNVFYQQDVNESKISATDETSAYQTINEYLLTSLGSELILNLTKEEFLHSFEVKTEFLTGDGESVISTGISETAKISYENQARYSYHSDYTLKAEFNYSLFKKYKNDVKYKFRSHLAFEQSETKYTGGINNILGVTALNGDLFFERKIHKTDDLVLAVNSNVNAYYPLENTLTLNTNYTSSKLVRGMHEYYQEARYGFGLGFSVCKKIKENNYKISFQYDQLKTQAMQNKNATYFNVKFSVFI